MEPESSLAQVPQGLRDSSLEAVYRLAWDRTGDGEPVREPHYRFHHGHRVALLCEQLLATGEIRAVLAAGGDGGDGGDPRVPLVVWLGAVLHDVAKTGVGGDTAGDHAVLGRDLVLEHLPDHYPRPVVERVAAVVYWHNKRERTPRRVELQVVQDADLLDHFGAMEVWLAGYYGAGRNEPSGKALAYLDSGSSLRWREYALTHAHFEVTRRALRERMDFSRRLTARLNREFGGSLFP